MALLFASAAICAYFALSFERAKNAVAIDKDDVIVAAEKAYARQAALIKSYGVEVGQLEEQVTLSEKARVVLEENARIKSEIIRKKDALIAEQEKAFGLQADVINKHATENGMLHEALKQQQELSQSLQRTIDDQAQTISAVKKANAELQQMNQEQADLISKLRDALKQR